MKQNNASISQGMKTYQENSLSLPLRNVTENYINPIHGIFH